MNTKIIEPNPLLEQTLRDWLNEPNHHQLSFNHHAILSPFYQAMRDAILRGGKRLRPFLVLQSAQLFGIKPEQALRVACAVEFIHGYSLVHDDLPAMDDDDFRRGLPTIHKAYDEATAILVGDALQTLAFEIMAQDQGFDGDVRCKLILELAKASGRLGMVGGQVMDMKAHEITAFDAAQQLSYVTDLQAAKTGALIRFSVMAGGIMAKKDDPCLEQLQQYGDALGLVFQITDDLLDIFGNADEVGKAIHKDESAGKITLVSLLGVEGAKAMACDQIALAKSAIIPLITNGNIDDHPLIRLADSLLLRSY